MASESSEGQTVSVELPSELDDWLETQATQLDIDKHQLLLQLLASYRATVESSGEIEMADQKLEPEQLATQVEKQIDRTLIEQHVDEELLKQNIDGELLDTITDEVRASLAAEMDEQIERTVKSVLADTLDQQIEDTVKSVLAETLEDRIQSTVKKNAESIVTDRVNEATNSVQNQLGNRVDSLESSFDEKIEDVRNRVIQVKRETDKKAPKDHTHDELARVAQLAETVEQLQTEIQQLRSEYEETVPEQESQITELQETLAETEDRLQTVAWVASDLRETIESGSGLEAVERIKRAGAKAEIEKAACGNCGETVVLSLLTDPECPHCNATVTNVDPNPGWFREPKLEVASQLESGDEQ